MSSLYTIVQYVPDPVADERVNIGVIVVGGGAIRGRFLRNWTRVRSFGGEDLAFLKDFASRVERWTPKEPPIPGLDTEFRLDEEGLRRIAGSWMNSIQFTELRGSLLAPAQLLEDMTRKFLRETTRARAGYRDRRTAARLAYTRVEDAVREVVGAEAKKLVRRNFSVDGSLDSHRFDVALQNGEIGLAAHGLSFEGPSSKELEKEIDATAWAVDDVKHAYPDLPLTIVAIPPRTSKSKTYDKALHVFDGLRADVIEESKVDDWAHEVAQMAKALI